MADFHLPHLADPVRDAMCHVTAVTAGSRYIAEWCRAAGAPRVDVVWTGAPVSAHSAPPQACRPPVIAWAQTRPMTYVREAAWVRDVIARLGQARPGLTLRLFDRQPGDDPGFAAGFETPGVTVEWQPAVPYKGYLRALEDVALGFAPLAPDTPFSKGKSFGKILGYLDRQVPVFVSNRGEPANFFTSETAVVSNSAAFWSAEAKRLLDDPAARSVMAEAASTAFEARLSVHGVHTCARPRSPIRACVERHPGCRVTGKFTIIMIIRSLYVPGAHSKLGCDKSPILLKSKENGHGPHRAGFA